LRVGGTRSPSTPVPLASCGPSLDVVRQINKGPDLRNIIVRIPRPRPRKHRRPPPAPSSRSPRASSRSSSPDNRSGIALKKEERGISKNGSHCRPEDRPARRLPTRRSPSRASSLVDSVQKLKAALDPLRPHLPKRQEHRRLLPRRTPRAPPRSGTARSRSPRSSPPMPPIAIENARLYKQSNQDRLTHLWNHEHFEKRLPQGSGPRRKANGGKVRRRHDRRSDDFKKVNDGYRPRSRQTWS